MTKVAYPKQGNLSTTDSRGKPDQPDGDDPAGAEEDRSKHCFTLIPGDERALRLWIDLIAELVVAEVHDELRSASDPADSCKTADERRGAA